MSFTTARLHGTKVPPVRELPVTAGQAFELGALLVKTGAGAYSECGADPTSVAAIAESGFGDDAAGFGAGPRRKEFPPGMMQGTKVMGEQPFLAEYIGTLPAADGASYGVVKDTDGRWKVDFADTTNLVVRLVGRRTDAPENVRKVEVIFLPAVVQII